MASLWTAKASPESPAVPGKDTAGVADTGLADVSLQPPEKPTSVPMSRPQLQRTQPQPPPPHQPPPPPAPQVNNPNDSLSLMQLRRIVTEFPKLEPTSYTFTYADTASFEEEVDEWFSYNDAEYKRLQRAKDTFQRRWRKFAGGTWIEANDERQEEFLAQEVVGLDAEDLRRRCKSLQTILHVILGVWDETAGAEANTDDTSAPKPKTKASVAQVEQMKKGITLVAQAEGFPVLFSVMQNAFKKLWDEDFRETKLVEEDIPFIQDELDNVTTILYIVIDAARSDPGGLQEARSKLMGLGLKLVNYLVTITAKLRWDEANELPQTRIFLLFWKSILLTFGGTEVIDEIKKATSEFKHRNADGSKLITASPLDYHIFRQEITSKYPAYTPPPPLIPLEPDNNSILPPLPNKPSRPNGHNGIIPAPIGVNTSGASILHQPVHIATPAPSPPPSPPVGGKAGKKQNYQTNQNFPFMYPPLDSTSNSAGGKGGAGLQDFLVGRRWEGSDIPASILEAGDLFSKRMRMTRSIRQLWDERERFMKYERGWDGEQLYDEDDDIEELDLETILTKKLEAHQKKHIKSEIDYGPNADVGEDIRQKLDMVEQFYEDSISNLQSLVIVLLKAILANVTALITQPMPPQGLAAGFRSEVNIRTNGNQPQLRAQDPASISVPSTIDPSELPIDEIEAMRSREITAKAVSGILLILLKWFKVSHILKFEYLTQLLLDSNYLPLVLKLFAHQEIDKVVDSKTDRDEMSFFSFCNAHSKNSQAETDSLGLGAEEESGDDAAPPPIKTSRDFPAAGIEDKLPALAFQEGQHAAKRELPEVDELGFPTNGAPSEPVTEFSWRNFFSSINFLRVMQKICKNKAHRNLLLVQYKSSNILRKSLKIPQPELRLYTLKLFKNQVPYCGRKWRQGNMRVITAVYLHCRPELRDDWLAGSDVDAEVEEALPLEQALRALTHWHNIKRYPDQMGADTKLLEEEHDFFVRELEKMEWIDEIGLEGESVVDGSMYEGNGY